MVKEIALTKHALLPEGLAEDMLRAAASGQLRNSEPRGDEVHKHISRIAKNPQTHDARYSVT